MTPDVDRATLGQRFQQRRKYLGYKQDEVARYLGIPRTAISQIEGGDRRIDALELQKLAKLYECTVAALLGEDDAQEADDELAIVARAARNLSDEDRAEVLRFAQYLRDRNRRNTNG